MNSDRPPHEQVTRTRHTGDEDDPLPPPPPTLGGYRVERLLGAGGMGAVYLAHDDRLGRPLALKTMRPEVAKRPGAVDRFLREARAAAQVSHDNVIPILHVGQDGDVPFIAMPLLEGESLDDLLDNDPIPPLGVALKVGRETADGLAAAHAKGLIHRDIKPANIWIEGNATAGEWASRFRRVKVLDFGLARPTGDTSQLTGDGAVIGTPAYMSPEQARGLPVDHRTDLFSLGVVLYRMTTGVLPFRGANAMAVLTQLAVDNPVPPTSLSGHVPPALSTLIELLLAKDRTRRPQSAAEVAEVLREIGRRLAVPTATAVVAPSAVVTPPAAVAPHPPAAHNPFAGLSDSPAADADDRTEVEYEREERNDRRARNDRREPNERPRRGGLWLAVGSGVAVLILAIGVAVALGLSKKDPPTDGPGTPTVKADPRAKGEPNTPKGKGDTKPPRPGPGESDPERVAARWIIDLSGKFTIRQPGGQGKPPAGGVPDGPFFLLMIDLTANAVTDADLAKLAELSGLESLTLSGTGITDAGLTHLKGLRQLKSLQLADTGVTDAGLAHLAGLTALTELNLSGNKDVGGDGLRHLRGLTRLARLNLNGTGARDAGAAHLRSLTGLVELELDGKNLTDAGVAHLAALKSLEKLTLHGQWRVTGDALKHLDGLKRLRHVDIRETGVKDAEAEAFRDKLGK